MIVSRAKYGDANSLVIGSCLISDQGLLDRLLYFVLPIFMDIVHGPLDLQYF
jgi:hypothetical protein